MRKTFAAALVLAALLAASPAFARGGGGVEYFVNAGSDLLPGIALPDGFLATPVSGTLMGVSGFGYGITRGGWKIGGFGTFFYSAPLGMAVPAWDMTVGDVVGGLGGIISGGHGRLGPFTLALNTRVGAGGMGIQGTWTDYPYPFWTGSFFLYGDADLELGLVMVPAMMISAYAGLQAMVAFPWGVPAVVPTLGARITWGRF